MRGVEEIFEQRTRIDSGKGDELTYYLKRGQIDCYLKRGRVDLPAKVKDEYVLTGRLQVAYGCGGSRRSSSSVHE